MNRYEQTRVDAIRKYKPRLMQLKMDDPACKHYQSYAIVKNSIDNLLGIARGGKKSYMPFSTNDTQLFTVIPVESMSTRDWQALFWLDIDKLVIDGVELDGGLCGSCGKYLECMQNGIGIKEKFECKTNHRHLLFMISRRSKTSKPSVTG